MLAYFRQEGENKSNNKIYQVWQQDNYPIEVGVLQSFGKRWTNCTKTRCEQALWEKLKIRFTAALVIIIVAEKVRSS